MNDSSGTASGRRCPDATVINGTTTLADVAGAPASALDSAIASSHWDFGDQKEEPIHRIHAYPAKFPAFITTKALGYAERNGVDVDLVADVFCGCGTTAVEAIRNGKSFWGCDINPVATLIAHVKTREYDDVGLRRVFEAINKAFEIRQPTAAERAQISDRIRYWFNDRNIEHLLRLRHAIHRAAPPKSRYRKFFLCAFSNILKPTSRWLTKSIKPQIDPSKSPREVIEAFAQQVALMRNAVRTPSMEVPSRGSNAATTAQRPRALIRTRNFLAPRLPACRPDLIVTSPPYVTSYNYADIHQLSALWLGFASDYRDLRRHMLGNEYRVNPLSPAVIEQLGSLAITTYDNLAKTDKRKASSVIRYFCDMSKAVNKCWNMLNEDGMAVFVIGNTRYQGTPIDNRRHLIHSMMQAGFREIEVFPRKISLKIMTPYRDARGRFTRDSGQRSVYGREFVVTGRRR
ncbi:DNA methyltransferase [Candidatus Palauibacter sp.]|uniref:DNA methyltransferase n=1 Tax=Candidatus Palauibacter sp. TaxID=3101350 RepID=UPI003D14B378